MLIYVKNPDLYREWIAYYERIIGSYPTAEYRTNAFFKSNRGARPPLI